MCSCCSSWFCARLSVLVDPSCGLLSFLALLWLICLWKLNDRMAWEIQRERERESDSEREREGESRSIAALELNWFLRTGNGQEVYFLWAERFLFLRSYLLLILSLVIIMVLVPKQHNCSKEDYDRSSSEEVNDPFVACGFIHRSSQHAILASK